MLNSQERGREGALAGKIALITGASGSLGRHIATVFAASGARVALAGRRLDVLNELAAELGAAGVRAIAVSLDVTSAGAVQLAIASVVEQLGALDIVVNNSGVTVDKPLLEQTEADWDRVLDTNLKGAFLVTTQAARWMRAAQRPGSVINIASILGLRQASRVAPYAASKAGLIQLTKSMALELARDNIRVNALAPGYIETDLNQAFFATAAGAAMIKRIPQRRLGALEDLDGALRLLACDESRYMTGCVIAIDGGHLLSSL